ncbi:putative reverse transcriptase zinc-binding domain-containing protein [Helianthus anomalus]
MGTNGSGWFWSWKRPPASPAKLTELANLIHLMRGFVLISVADRWTWVAHDSGVFSVFSLKSFIQPAPQSARNYMLTWNNWVPKKVCLLAWRADKDRLPTRVGLARRSIQVPTILCVFCGEADETSEHLFVSCSFAQSVWQLITQWCKVSSIYAFGFRDLLVLHWYSRIPKKKMKAFHAIILKAIWCIWRMRNDMVFNRKPPSLANVIGSIKVLSLLWVKNMVKERSITSSQWRAFDVFNG